MEAMGEVEGRREGLAGHFFIMVMASQCMHMSKGNKLYTLC